MSGALFGSSATGSRPSSKNLVEFRAGKMDLKGSTVTPDKRKGLVYLHQSDDSLMHFCWKDRSTGSVVDDLIIFPDDCEFKRVPQCKTGRVYILRFKSSARKFFFWMQEPKTEKDEELCKKVNEMLNNPPAPGSTGLGGGRGTGGLPGDLGALSSLGEGGLQSMLGNMDQQQMMQLLSGGGLGGLGPLGLQSMLGGPRSSTETSSSRNQSASGARPATTTATTTAATTSAASSQPSSAPASQTTASASASTPSTTTTPATTARPATTPAPSGQQTPIQLSDLQSILSSMNIPTEGAAGQPAVDLSQLMTSEAMAPILANQEIQQRLIPHLPEGETLPKDPEELRATLQSPQFKQALGMFTAAFQSGQLGPLMGQFGLSQEATDAANKGDIEGFSKALQGPPGNDDKKSDKKDDDDDAMHVD